MPKSHNKSLRVRRRQPRQPRRPERQGLVRLRLVGMDDKLRRLPRVFRMHRRRWRPPSFNPFILCAGLGYLGLLWDSCLVAHMVWRTGWWNLVGEFLLHLPRRHGSRFRNAFLGDLMSHL